MALLDKLLKGRIKQGLLTIIHADGSESLHGTPTDGWPNVTLRIHQASAERRILMNPALGIGECYMDGAVSIDDEDIMGLVSLVQGNNPWERRDTIDAPRWWQRALTPLSRLVHQANSLTSSRSNVAHHYDLSNDFYRLWLDEDMQYSCAYWDLDDAKEPKLNNSVIASGAKQSRVKSGNPGLLRRFTPRNDDFYNFCPSLDQAQSAKKAHIAAKLALKPGQRVLDIGCGWGGTALYLHRVAGVEVLGITLSEEQLKLARERAEAAGVADKVRFELMDYRDLAKRAPGYFDRIVSIGMFEHVGVPQFETFFRACANLMKDDGVMLLHTIGRMGGPGYTDAFTRKYIFPGGYIPALSETLAASEKMRLIHSDIENLRLHYAFTLREWYKRTMANRDAIVAQYDERFYRMWLFYLAGAVGAFEAGGLCNYQIQFTRNRHALPITRDYIGVAERGLLGKA
jgi:cyclopropane-fatty-acyl-phospholipid synthase